MQIGVLGRLRVLRDGAELDLGPHKQRALLAGLALHAGEVVSADRLSELLWGDRPPAAVAASLHGYVAALRRVLEPDRAARQPARVLLTIPPGYRLALPVDALDTARFTAAVREVHGQLAVGPAVQRSARLGQTGLLPADLPPALLEEALDRLGAALALWRGPPFAELEGEPAVEAERTRLQDLRLEAVQDRARVLLALGRPAAAAAELGPLAHEHPLREDLTALLALSLALSDRQVEALAALRTTRQALADELGLDPGRPLQELELAVLRREVGAPGPATGPVASDQTVGAATNPAGGPAGPRQPGPEAGTLPPLAGRERELEALTQRLAAAAAGVSQRVVLVGEAGIGKTRLTIEVAAAAQQRGFLVLTGRCSSDEGAPPLWPWLGVLRRLKEAVPDVSAPGPEALLTPAGAGAGAGAAQRFQLFDSVLTALSRVARQAPVLLVLDDLHWADASTLRLLQHLVESSDRDRLMLLLTRRPQPEPTGALSDLASALARRGVLRLDVEGLSAEEVQALVDADGTTDLGADQVRRLRERTGGNPFYVTELLRWRAARSGPAGGTGVPPAVGDVVAARVGQLPAGTQQLLRGAAALTRRLDPALLASLEGLPVDAVLDGLEPAVAAGLLVVEPLDGSLRFSHALVKDAVEASDPPLRRQRRHARLAQLLDEREPTPGRLAERAQHWLRAGPEHAGRAWRAASEAAQYATSLGAHEEAAELLAAAVASQRADTGVGWLERYELLMSQGRSCRAAADSEGQRTATATAMGLASAAGDVERLARAAITSSTGALWSNRPEGETDPATLSALHRAAAELPGADTVLRCQVFLALSRELFWAPGHREAEAWAEQGLAMARRLGDPQLQAWGCHTLIVSCIRPATLVERRRLAAESVRCARTAGDPELEAVGLFWQAVFAGEAGRPGERAEAVEACRRIAEQQRLRYLQVMLGSYDVPWLAMQGRFDGAAVMLAATERWAVSASFPFRDEAVAAAHAWLALFEGRVGGLLDSLVALDQTSPTDMGTTLLLLLLRSGRLEEAAHHLDRRPVPLVDDDFAVLLDLAIGAEAALLLARPPLAAAVYPLLAPWAGRVAAAGTGGPIGPVDAFLALAAAAVGERSLATSHADEAARLCSDWGLVPVAAWLTALRKRFAF